MRHSLISAIGELVNHVQNIFSFSFFFNHFKSNHISCFRNRVSQSYTILPQVMDSQHLRPMLRFFVTTLIMHIQPMS